MRSAYPNIRAVTGFICIFIPYQLAEIFIRFYNNIPLFLGLMLLAIMAGYFFTKKLFHKNIFVYDTGVLRNNSRNLLVGLGVGVATYFGAYYLSRILSLEVPGRNPDWEVVVTELLLFTMGTLLPSLAEDVLTRGYLFSIRGKQYSPYYFVFFSSAIYVLNHTYALRNGPVFIMYLFITGLSLAIPMVLTRSIWYTFGLHWTCNIIYRMSNDIFQNNQVPGKALSSLIILCIVVACFIPINIAVIRILNRGTVPA